MLTIPEIISSHRWEDLYSTDQNEARKQYRAYVRIVHPDVNDDPQASAAFIKVQRYYALAQTGVKSSTTSKPSTAVKILLEDDVFTLTKVEGKLFWFVRNAKDNDLVQHIPQLLETLKATRGAVFFPQVGTPLKDAKGRSGVQVNYPERTWSLSHFHDIADRNIVWIFKRILVALILTQESGYVHGNLSAKSILIIPEDHGLLLDNWGYAVKQGQKLKIKPESYVPDRYLKGSVADSWVDIASSADLMLQMGVSNMHPRLKNFFTALKKYTAADPAQILQEFEELTVEVFGAPRFNVLEVPDREPLT